MWAPGGSLMPRRSGGHQYFGLIEGTRWYEQDRSPGTETGWIDLQARECPDMKHRMTRAWQLAMAIAPLAAIALVEAAMKRWS